MFLGIFSDENDSLGFKVFIYVGDVELVVKVEI